MNSRAKYCITIFVVVLTYSINAALATSYSVDLDIYCSSNQIAGTGPQFYIGSPSNFYASPYAPTGASIYGLGLSANIEAFADSSNGGEYNIGTVSSAQDIVSALEAGNTEVGISGTTPATFINVAPATIPPDENPADFSYGFTTDASGLSDFGNVPASITYGINGSKQNKNPVLTWYGPPVGYDQINVSVYNPSTGESQSDVLSSNDTSWMPPGSLDPGTWDFTVVYYGSGDGDISTSAPTNDLGESLPGWEGVQDITLVDEDVVSFTVVPELNSLLLFLVGSGALVCIRVLGKAFQMIE